MYGAPEVWVSLSENRFEHVTRIHLAHDRVHLCGFSERGVEHLGFIISIVFVLFNGAVINSPYAVSNGRMKKDVKRMKRHHLGYQPGSTWSTKIGTDLCLGRYFNLGLPECEAGVQTTLLRFSVRRLHKIMGVHWLGKRLSAS
jgi:hypothetical protein